MTTRITPLEAAECRKRIVHAGEKRSDQSGEQRGGCAIGPAGGDPERAAGEDRKRRCRGGPQRKPMIAVRDGGVNASGVKASSSGSGSRPSAIASRRSRQSCMTSTRLRSRTTRPATVMSIQPASASSVGRISSSAARNASGFLVHRDRRLRAIARSLRRLPAMRADASSCESSAILRSSIDPSSGSSDSMCCRRRCRPRAMFAEVAVS